MSFYPPARLSVSLPPPPFSKVIAIPNLTFTGRWNLAAVWPCWLTSQRLSYEDPLEFFFFFSASLSCSFVSSRLRTRRRTATTPCCCTTRWNWVISTPTSALRSSRRYGPLSARQPPPVCQLPFLFLICIPLRCLSVTCPEAVQLELLHRQDNEYSQHQRSRHGESHKLRPQLFPETQRDIEQPHKEVCFCIL